MKKISESRKTMRKPVSQIIICIKGAGEMASAVAWRLYMANIRRIFMLEVPQPLAVRRKVSFCEAVYNTRQTVENVPAVLAANADEARAAWLQNCIAVLVDPDWQSIKELQPDVVVDATLAKRNLGTGISEALLVIGLGPGFTAGRDVHTVIETNRGHNLGRIITAGTAEPNTGIPGSISGYTVERVLRAPAAGCFQSDLNIGHRIKRGDVIGTVGGLKVCAEIDGVLRGLVRTGIDVPPKMKLGDIDPRGIATYCDTISDKARAISGSVLEAVLREFPGPAEPEAHEDRPRGKTAQERIQAEADALAKAVVNGETRAVSRAIRNVENQADLCAPLMDALHANTGKAHRVGITGPPGVGKSTFTNRLVRLFRAAGKSVGVIAVDPSSPYSGGAILGDRLRMQAAALDPKVFIRSMASRGSSGGLTRQAAGAADILDAAGKDIILFETVGVGQVGLDIASAAGTIIVMTMPETGDVIQGMKSGLMEIGDIFIVNKADLPGADRMRTDLELAIGMRANHSDWQPSVWLADSKKGAGLKAIYAEINTHFQYLERLPK
jgi:xanthine dehydrogenase accessory factor